MKQILKKYYVYIVSSVIITAVILVVLGMKHFWPFGDATLLSGDFGLESWPFLMELKRKLASGDSLIYTWDAGFGTNYFGIVTGILNPMTLIYLCLPIGAIMPASTIMFIGLELATNWAMLYYLTHRPYRHLEQNQIANMLFSMAYTMSMYMVSNINNWHMMVSAILFPLILLGLERFVKNQDWKLYYITLTLAFLSGYYMTCLFCFFIILYYLTLEFESFRVFCRKSWKIFLLSVAAVLTNALVMLPGFAQMLQQNYTISEYKSNTWFVSYFDIFKNFLAFNCAIDRGSSYDSYGEVNLYIGLLMVMLLSLYFFNRKIPKWTRLRKLAVLVIYILAFNLNGLNYVMHMFHYPSWFPNRFSIFFMLFCIILGYEEWCCIKEEEYTKPVIWQVVVVGVGWTLLTIACFAFAKDIGYQFTYYYSMMIFLFYMVGIMFFPYGKQKLARVLSMVGVLELCLCFGYAMIYRDTSTKMRYVKDAAAQEEQFVKQLELEEEHGFSRMTDYGDIVATNQGMLLGYKGTSVFTSTISNASAFLQCIGIYAGTNVYYAQYLNPIPMALFNIQYVYVNHGIGDYALSDSLYPAKVDLMHDYTEYAGQGDLAVYESPRVLALGYMVSQNAKDAFSDNVVQYNLEHTSVKENINTWVEAMSGVPNVMEDADSKLELEVAMANNCEMIVKDNTFFVKSAFTDEELATVQLSRDEIITGGTEYDETASSAIRFDFTAKEAGEYFIQIGKQMTTTGYLNAGDVTNIYYELEDQLLDAAEGVHGEFQVYRIQEEQWQQAYDKLAQHQLEVTDYTSTSIEGTITVGEDNLFFTSIPYDENWHLYVDGVETETTPLWSGAFLAAQIPEGEHTIRLEYHQSGLAAGLIITCAALIGMLAMMVIERKKHKSYFLETTIEKAATELHIQERRNDTDDKL